MPSTLTTMEAMAALSEEPAALGSSVAVGLAVGLSVVVAVEVIVVVDVEVDDVDVDGFAVVGCAGASLLTRVTLSMT